MNTKTVLNRLVLLTLAAMVASILIPSPTTAQSSPGQFQATFSITKVTPPATALIPDGPVGQIKVDWTYSIPNTIVTANQVLAGSTTLHFTPAPKCEGAGILLTGATAVPITIPQPSQGQNLVISLSNSFNVQATSDAPGETSVNCSFTGYVDAWGQNNQVPQTAPSTNSAPVVVKYLGLVSANVPITIDEAGPQKTINYAIKLTNLGNSRTFVNFNVVDTHSTDGWNPIAPGQISLESKNQGGSQTTADANFLVSTPYHNGWNNKETTFQLKIQPQSTKDPQLVGNEVSVNILARVRGIYVPGPEPMLIGLGVLAAAFIVRARKSA